MNARLFLAPAAACLLAGSLTVPAAAVPPPDVELSSPAATAEPAETAATAASVFARMSEAQRLGQLFMVGTPAASVDPTTRAQIGRYHVGNAMLTGRS
ncbi:MAG TPA: hypothetical protein VFY87_07235, partial [Geminicoccaceae bacterium]|nr:hypothetical protein [Geminicoccaceae bacterium]